MSISSNGDLIDIVEQLKFQNNVIQAQGFSQLLEKLTKTNFGNQKEKIETENVLFDCIQSFGTDPSQWMIEILPYLIEKEVFTEDRIINEVSIRLNKVDNPEKLLVAVIETCKPSVSVLLKIFKKVEKTSVFRIFSDKKFLSENVTYLKVLLLTDILSPEQKRALLNSSCAQNFFVQYNPVLYPDSEEELYNKEKFLNNCSNIELLSNDLKNMNVFQTLRLIEERNIVLMNEKLKMHILYLPELISILQSRQIAMKPLNETKMAEEMKHIRQLISTCQNIPKSEIAEPEFDVSSSLERMFNSVVSNQKTLDNFLSFVEFHSQKPDFFDSRNFLMLIVALLPYCKDRELLKRTCCLIVQFVEKNPHKANTIVLYFISLFAKAFFEIDRSLIVETLTKLAINRFVITPIVKFFCAMCQLSIKERCQIYESLGYLVEKYPTIYDTVAPVVKTFPTEEAEDIFLAKLNLAKKCCLSTDECDELLSALSKLLKEDGTRLAHTIDIILELCKNDVLEFKTVRKQLLRKVGSPVNEKALEAYCRLLSLGAVPDKEASEATNEELRVECIKELFQLTKHINEKVAADAWRSLGCYGVAEIEEIVKVDISSVILTFGNLRREERRGFVDFLHNLIGKEVEMYPRPLYNTTSTQSVIVPPLFSKVDTYKDMLLLKNKDEPWFWRATLPLTAPILKLTSSSNKALGALRLIRSCATLVASSTDHEDMIRLIASWRICMRESLNCLAESRNNDVLWARDQICEEGKRCLTDCSESVDNIMMMLTTLTDVIEDKMKEIDDQKQVDQIVKSQKPWIISVFEFCATRLPKVLKQKREKKSNPIYQILTQSTKSSLHIAIFCVRMMHRNPAIFQFYGDGDDLCLAKDVMLTSLLIDSSAEISNEEVPDRKMLWINAEAYNADFQSTKVFESIHCNEIEKKTMVGDIDVILERLSDESTIQEFFGTLSQSKREEKLEYQARSKKVLEKLWNNGNEDVKKTIYMGLAELELCSAAENSKTKKILALEKLPEKSVLRHAIHLFEDKYDVDEDGLQLLMKSFILHKRSDGRYLPSIDWFKLMKKANWETVKHAEIRKNLLTLACEQSIEEVIFKTVNSVETPLSNQELLVMANHFSSVCKVLPRRVVEDISRKLISLTRQNQDQNLCSIIGQNQSDPVVRQVLPLELPTLKNCEDLNDPILNCLTEPQEFVGAVSSVYDFWIEVRLNEAMKMKRLCDLYAIEQNNLKRNSMVAILSTESSGLTEKRRLEKILDVITLSRIARSSSSDMIAFLPIILALIVTGNSSVEMPTFYYGSGENIMTVMCEIRRGFIFKLVKSKEMVENVKHIASFLLPYISGNEAGFYETWQRDVAKDLLLFLLSNYSSQVMQLVENEDDEFWKNLLN